MSIDIHTNFDNSFHKAMLKVHGIDIDENSEETVEDLMFAKEMFTAGLFAVIEGNVDGMREFLNES